MEDLTQNRTILDVFKKLSAVDVSKKIAKKGELSYLPWADAWGMVKAIYPDANYKVYEREDGCNYFTDGRTCWVKTGVTIAGHEHIEYLPVMNYRNQSILLENITSCDVNKTIQRSITKAIARHGLGLNIYSGEDFEDADVSIQINEPEEISIKKSNPVDEIRSEFEMHGISEKKVMEFLHMKDAKLREDATTFDELPAYYIKFIKDNLQKLIKNLKE